MWSEFQRALKKRRKGEAYENVCCANCKTVFSGHFCPNCGQAYRNYDKPFSFIFYNFLGDFYAFDIRFFRTLSVLIARPGFLTKEYFAGRRVRYAPPMRVFIFVSFLLFFLLQVYTNRGLTTVLDSDLSDKTISLDSTSLLVVDSVVGNVRNDLESADKAVADSFLIRYGMNPDSGSVNDLNFKGSLETFRDTRDLRNGLNKYAEKLEGDLEKEADPEKKAELREYIRLCRSPESAMAKILKYISYAFFLLLPIFALLLKLVYIRRKQNYMRHLIFSIHVHSFIFLLLTLVLATYTVVKVNQAWLATLVVFTIPVYIIIALKKFYGQHIGKVTLKFFALSFMYNIIFMIVIVWAALDAINVV